MSTLLKELKIIARVIIKQTLKEHNIDVFVMGDDWIGEFDFLKKHCEVVYLPRTKDISTTIVKEFKN